MDCRIDFELDKKKLDYVFFHLNQHCSLEKILPDLYYGSLENYMGNQRIVFIESKKPIDVDAVFFIDDLPVLSSSMPEKKQWYEIRENSLFFYHDVLKSAFFLLSGMQEWHCSETDKFGRFPFAASIQKSLNIVQKPVVNYYFELIVKAIGEFLKDELPVFRKNIFPQPSLLFTSDVDLLHKYTFRYFFFRIKSLFIRPKNLSTHLAELKNCLFSWIGLKNDPYHSFSFLEELAGKGVVSYFLLAKRGRKDANYSLNKRALKEISLPKNGLVGLHGSYASFSKSALLKKERRKLEAILKCDVAFVRQHFLRYQIQKSPYIHEELNLTDCSLAFAEHPGYRNSYCFPFKLFDFKNNRIFSHWEIPLQLMDASLYVYQNISSEEIKLQVKTLAEETKKFNGLLCVLWHNSFLDNSELPGIRNEAMQLMQLLDELRPIRISEVFSLLKNTKEQLSDETEKSNILKH